MAMPLGPMTDLWIMTLNLRLPESGFGLLLQSTRCPPASRSTTPWRDARKPQGRGAYPAVSDVRQSGRKIVRWIRADVGKISIQCYDGSPFLLAPLRNLPIRGTAHALVKHGCGIVTRLRQYGYYFGWEVLVYLKLGHRSGLRQCHDAFPRQLRRISDRCLD